ncbi:hypothetical protein SARC_07202 [Sphaeroforma arctica JP610]|uniref:Uncharacterized protein n=1 Tax=Sphaeroforma arctica JP610 TaxID=667725 RepID=A0A0L0FV42_9EUKA|nr:hypothetical protein SARC_07202 [Sphaeroforma arctica JP610]KNC80431.1 hypothetical protein SARC_07202 [Sphaeroforma arctica JP610]|eukprot:XP_014154333.1 hypothetical protein SARC_07202 [Sphaeroforma arctica JP610]
MFQVARLAIILTLMGVVGMVCGFASKLAFGTVSTRLGHRIRRLYVESVLRQDMAFLSMHTAGELSNRLALDIKLIEDALGDTLQLLSMLVGLCVSGIAVGFAFSWQLAIATVTMTPMIAISGAYLSYALKSSAERSSTIFARAGAIAEESLSLIRTVTAFNGQRFERERFNGKLHEAYRLAISSHIKNGLLVGLAMFIMLASNAWSLWFASQLVGAREMSPGVGMTVFFAIVMASLGLGQMFTPASKISRACGVAYNVYKVIDHIPAINALDTTGSRLENVSGCIEFRGVTFTYPPTYDARADEKAEEQDSLDLRTSTSYIGKRRKDNAAVLRNFNLTIDAGTKVAIVGGSGSGKSTTIRLIQRLYDPEAGSISLDGVNLKQLNVQWLRGAIGLVSQEPRLFSGTIAENIALGSGVELNDEFEADLVMDSYLNRLYNAESVSMEQIVNAATLANAHDFIMQLPDGYDTLIGHSGQLSGGQKQRIAIARAIVRDPKIVLLDEATSALDVASEVLVQKALQQATAGRTTIMVAHRLTTIRDADVIFVVADGHIVERGSHDELRYKKNGYYAKYFDTPDSSTTTEQGHQGSDHSQTLATRLDSGSEADSDCSEMRRLNGSPDGYGLDSMDDNTATQLTQHDIASEKSFPHSAATQSDSLEDNGEVADREVLKANGVTRRVYRLNRPEWPLFILGGCGAILVGLVWPCYAWFFGELIFLLMNNDQGEVDTMVIKFIVLAAVAFVGNVINTVCFGYANERLVRRVRRMLFSAYMRQDVAWFDIEDHLPSSLESKLASDALAVTGVTGSYLSTQITLLAALCGALVVGFVSCWQLAFLLFTIVPMVGLGVLIGLRITGKAQHFAYMQLAEGNERAVEAIDEARTILGLGSAPVYKFLDDYRTALGKPGKALERALVYNSFAFGFSQLVVLSVWGGAFYYGMELIKGAHCDIIGMIRTVCAVIFGGLGLGQVLAVIPNPKAAQIAATWIFNIVDRVPLGAEVPSKKEKKGKYFENTRVRPSRANKPLQGEVEFRDVQFAYPSRPQAQVLKRLSLKIMPGEVVGIVGESGSGKSTLVSLLERFYTAQDGDVLLDGQPISEYDVSWLRTQIGLVSQEPHLFSSTVRENLLYGHPAVDTISEDHLMDCLKEANAMEFVSQLPLGVDTLVGEKGGSMSGGMKQRLAIARMLLRNPSIILLDEATSALDNTSERLVQTALDRVMSGRTTIIVAHKLATLAKADKIVVVVKGEVKEMGTHQELEQAGGLFTAMLKQQRDATE